MATLVAIAITPLVVFAVVSTMSQQHVPKIAAPRLNALFVAEVTQLTSGIANLTWILKKDYYRTLQRISRIKVLNHLE